MRFKNCFARCRTEEEAKAVIQGLLEDGGRWVFLDEDSILRYWRLGAYYIGIWGDGTLDSYTVLPKDITEVIPEEITGFKDDAKTGVDIDEY